MPVSLTIELYVVRRLLIGLCAILIGLSLVATFFKYVLGYQYVLGFVAQFSLDNEHNVPTYFSSFLLLLAAVLLMMVAKYRRAIGARDVRYWCVLSIIFAYLSIDELAVIHEMVIEPLRNSMTLSGVLHFSWVLIGIVVVLVLAAFYVRFIFRLPSLTRIQFILAACLYVGGALGVEMTGGYYAANFGEDNITYSLITTLEESLELIGVSLFVFSLLQYLANEEAGYRVRICESRRPTHNGDMTG